jgi:predicted DNA-binding transcriptional regulator AlpA
MMLVTNEKERLDRAPTDCHASLTEIRDTLLAPLITAKETAALYSMSVPSLRRHDSAGLIPRPVRIRGIVRWRLDEVLGHIRAGCPERDTWEKLPESKQWTRCPR